MKKLLILPLILIAITIHAQLSQDSVMARQLALQSDFVNKIKAMGFTPSLPAPNRKINVKLKIKGGAVLLEFVIFNIAEKQKRITKGRVATRGRGPSPSAPLRA